MTLIAYFIDMIYLSKLPSTYRKTEGCDIIIMMAFISFWVTFRGGKNCLIWGSLMYITVFAILDGIGKPWDKYIESRFVFVVFLGIQYLCSISGIIVRRWMQEKGVVSSRVAS